MQVNETEAKLLEILRKMRSLGNSDSEMILASVYLINTITALAEDTIYADLAYKIMSAYAGILDPGVPT
jgi:hypothetical protein